MPLYKSSCMLDIILVLALYILIVGLSVVALGLSVYNWYKAYQHERGTKGRKPGLPLT